MAHDAFHEAKQGGVPMQVSMPFVAWNGAYGKSTLTGGAAPRLEGHAAGAHSNGYAAHTTSPATEGKTSHVPQPADASGSWSQSPHSQYWSAAPTNEGKTAQAAPVMSTAHEYSAQTGPASAHAGEYAQPDYYAGDTGHPEHVDQWGPTEHTETSAAAGSPQQWALHGGTPSL